MIMRNGSPSSRSPNRTPPQIHGTSIGTSIRTSILRFAVACLLGGTTALLISCGSSGKGLIPAADAGPLRSDFEAVASDAHNGNGNCTATEAAIFQTEHDFGALPANIDSGLHERLQAGIKNLRERALELCTQATATSTSSKTTTSTQSTSTTPTATQTTSTQTAPTTTGPTTSSSGGGTPAPSESGGASGPANGGGSNNPGGAGGGGREGAPGSGNREQGGGVGGTEGGR
jgi:hypothetical protein